MAEKYYINGIYLTGKVTGGIKRFSLQAVKALEKEAGDGVEFEVVCPPDADIPAGDGGKIKYVRTGRFKSNLWEQISLPRYVNRKKGMCISLCNSFPAGAKRNVIFVHDVRPIEEKTEGKSSLFIKKFSYLLKRAKKKNTPVLTVSRFSKSRIEKLCGYPGELITVVRIGCDHPYGESGSAKCPCEGEYYLSVSSVMPHKNFSFITELAKLHTDKQFYIIGQKFQQAEDSPNVKFLGYVPDGVLAACYKGAEALIAPSLYEGFGLTPMEALSFGCKKIYLSDIEVFREIYGGAANYFDPRSPEKFGFDGGKEVPESARQALLENYTWENCARDILAFLGTYKKESGK